MIKGILLLVDVGCLTGASATGILVDVGILVDDVLSHKLLLIGFLHTLFTLQLVLITILAVGDDGASLTILSKYFYNCILNVLNLENISSGEILFLAQRKHLVGIFASGLLVVTLMANGIEVFQNSNLNLSQVKRHYLAVTLLYLDHGSFCNIVLDKNGKLFSFWEHKSFPFWITLSSLTVPEVVCFCSFCGCKGSKKLNKAEHFPQLFFYFFIPFCISAY